jgi:hypothetical protein
MGWPSGPLVPASVKTVQDFLGWARANPKDASYGSPAAGIDPALHRRLLGLNNQVELKHVPYRGSVPGVTDVVGGQLAAMVTPHGDFIPNHKAGKLRILATSGKQRSPFVPEVPTFAEQGFADLTVEEWFGFLRARENAGRHGDRGQCRHQCRHPGQIRHRLAHGGGADSLRRHRGRHGVQPEARVRSLGPADQKNRLHRGILMRRRAGPGGPAGGIGIIGVRSLGGRRHRSFAADAPSAAGS